MTESECVEAVQKFTFLPPEPFHLFEVPRVYIPP